MSAEFQIRSDFWISARSFDVSVPFYVRRSFRMRGRRFLIERAILTYADVPMCVRSLG